MRIPFISMFMTSPFEGLLDHAEKIKECVWAFQQAIECHITDQCESFEEFRIDVDNLESEADAIKRRIRGHLPKGTLLPVDKFELFRYLHEQDKVLDAVEEALDWISFRSEPGIPDALHKDFQYQALQPRWQHTTAEQRLAVARQAVSTFGLSIGDGKLFLAMINSLLQC